MLPFRKTAKHTKAKSSLKRLNKHQNQSLIGHFPGGPVVRKPQFHCRDAGSIPGQRTRIPHAMCCAPQPKNKTKAKKKKVMYATHTEIIRTEKLRALME